MISNRKVDGKSGWNGSAVSYKGTGVPGHQNIVDPVEARTGQAAAVDVPNLSTGLFRNRPLGCPRKPAHLLGAGVYISSDQRCSGTIEGTKVCHVGYWRHIMLRSRIGKIVGSLGRWRLRASSNLDEGQHGAGLDATYAVLAGV